MSLDEFESRRAELERQAKGKLGYQDRAWRIVDRVLPKLQPAHGFYDSRSSIRAARRLGDRNYLSWMIFARLRAKAEGGDPHIDLPYGCEESLRGSAMWNAANALADDPDEAWRRVVAYVSKERGADHVT